MSTIDANGVDLDTLRDFHDTNVNGVKLTDVDWFLRDPDIEVSNDKIKDTSSNVATNGFIQTLSNLDTNISNSNNSNHTKTKPSIAPIKQENVTRLNSNQDLANSPRSRRNTVTSLSSQNSNLSGGFFSKLKGKFHKEVSTPLFHDSDHQDSTPSSPNPLFKSNYSMSESKVVDKSPNDILLRRNINKANNDVNNHNNGDNNNGRQNTNAVSNVDEDPRLEEYIKFYQKPDTCFRRKSSVALDSPLPSALINNYDNVLSKSFSNNSSTGISRKDSIPGKFSFFRKKTLPNTLSNSNFDSKVSVDSIVSNNNFSSSQESILPQFKDLKPLKRVAFHSSTFLIDPPQQIPSRNPRKGNVIFEPNGTIKILPLTEEDKIMITKSQIGQGGGIVVGGSGALGYIKKEDEQYPGCSDVTIKDDSSKKTNNGDNDNDDDEPDTAIDSHMKNVAIDKPLIHSQPNYYSAPIKKMALDLMYTRCCHLREILPIPAILKQIPKGSMAPIPLLQLRNPYPTMVEIQTFADFIRVAPIICISFDAVNLSLEQFKILLSAMAAKSHLEKLSLRNTPISHEGWSLLCWFLSRNKILNKLDITQCPSLSLNILKKKKRKSSDSKKFDEDIKRMVCNKDNRSEMDWSLFVATMVARGGIDELILTGCCINDVDIFEKLIKMVAAKSTSRLGLAYNKLCARQFKILVDNWLFTEIAKGIDLGYNDFLSRKMLSIFLDKKNDPDFKATISNANLAFLSLNATNLRFSESFTDVFDMVVMKLPNLKYLDLSNNPRLFGTLTPEYIAENSRFSFHLVHQDETPEKKLSPTYILNYFTCRLPLFPYLIRLHLEHNNFSTDSIVEIAKVLPFCKHLSYFSLVGNEISIQAASALIQAVKNSSTLITLDCEYSNLPDLFKESLGLYSMRNMENMLYASKNSNSIPEDEESETLTEQLNKILAVKAEKKLDLKSPAVVKFIKRANRIRSELQKTISELLKLQLKNELNLEGKETLIRFIFLDSSIETGLQLIDSSLVDSNDAHSNAIYSMSAEDEKNKYVQRGIDATDTPISVANDDATDINANVPSISMSRSSSRTSLNQLNREEGSVLKLLSLHKYHIPDEGDFEGKFEEISGEEIRKKILGVDLKDVDLIIKYLNTLKEQGVSLEKVYLNAGEQESQYVQQLKTNTLKLDDIENKLNDLTKLDPAATSKIEKVKAELYSDLNLKSLDDEKGTKDGVAINRAYDKFLDTIKDKFENRCQSNR
jgi:hypothetical protein